MKKNSMRRLALVALCSASLLSGCNQPSGAGAAPNSSASPVVAEVKVDTTEVKPGDGPEIDENGGVMMEVKIWQDKFEGQPFGNGEAMPVMLAPKLNPLPGLTSAIKGMKKGGVRRAAIPAKDLFAQIPEGSGLTPDKMFYLEITLTDVYPEEPFENTTVTPGSGDKSAAQGDIVKIHYVGTLEGFDSKKVFDSSRERGTPITVKIGEGQVIAGWEKGLEGIKKGEVRRLSIPHYLAYGDRAQGEEIPAKSRLFFELEAVDFVEPGELKQVVTKPGKGEEITAGQSGKFHYTGWLDGFDGKSKFDSSKDRGTPFTVQLGAGQVIKGWDDGLIGMKPGETRRLEIPYNLAYGDRGQGPIPPYSTLYFEVEYLGLDAGQGTATPAPKASPTP